MLKHKNKIISLLITILAISLVFVYAYITINSDSPVKGNDISLIKNGSFENVLDGWIGLSAVASQSSSEQYNGDYSLKLKDKSSAFVDGKIQSSNFEIKTNARYVISLFIKVTVNNSTKFQIELVEAASDGGVAQNTFVYAQSDEFQLSEYLDEGWKKITLPVEVSSTQDEQLNVCLILNFSTEYGYKTTLFIDDIKMEEKKNVAIQDGATLRLDGQDSGIRFTGKVDKDYYDGLVSTYGKENVSAGIITAPLDYIQNVEHFTVEELTLNNIPYLDMESAVWKNEEDSSKTEYQMDCVITNIKPQNIDRDFVARAYVKYYVEEQVHYIYSSFSPSINKASAKSLAQELLKTTLDTDKDYAMIDYYATAGTEESITEYSNVNVSGKKIIKINFNSASETTLTVQANGVELKQVSIIKTGNEYSYCYYLKDEITKINLTFNSAVTAVKLKTYSPLPE